MNPCNQCKKPGYYASGVCMACRSRECLKCSRIFAPARGGRDARVCGNCKRIKGEKGVFERFVYGSKTYG